MASDTLWTIMISCSFFFSIQFINPLFDSKFNSNGYRACMRMKGNVGNNAWYGTLPLLNIPILIHHFLIVIFRHFSNGGEDACHRYPYYEGGEMKEALSF